METASMTNLKLCCLAQLPPGVLSQKTNVQPIHQDCWQNSACHKIEKKQPE